MKKIILLILLFLSIPLVYSFAEVPCKINYQGRLIENNMPVDGTRKMRFTIYDSPHGGVELWTSEDVNITVYNGLFRYVLDLSSIDDWTAGEELYLQVIVDEEPLTPLEAIYAYPYAINSHLLEGKTTDYFLNRSAETQKKDGGLNIMGNVGIGTTSPGARLDVQGGPNNAQGGISLGTLNTQGGWVSSPEDLNFVVDNTNRIQDRSFFFRDGTAGFVLMTIQENGNVGIGTTSPGEKLTVTGTIESTTGGVKFPDGTLQATAAALQAQEVTGTNNVGTSATSWVNMDNMSITMTTTGGPVLLMFNGIFYGSGDPQYRLQFYESPGGNSYVFYRFVRTSYHEPNWYWNVNGTWLCTGLSAGTHTFRVRWRTNQGAVWQNGTVVPRHFIAMELK